VGFEPTISAGERPQTYALSRAVTVVNYELENISKVPWHIFKYCSDVSIGRLRTAMNISQDGQPLGGDLNLRCPNYDAEGITT